jgi:preprotein translocase SecE subunit
VENSLATHKGDTVATHKIVASDSGRPVKEKTVKPAAAKVKKAKKTDRKNPFVRLGGYFVGAWHELREVRWPNRKATWSLTLAVLGFVIFFTVLITLLDALYKYLFELILK